MASDATPPRHDAPRGDSPERPSTSLETAAKSLAVVALIAGAATWVFRAPVDRKGAFEETEPTAEPTSSGDSAPPPPPRCARAGTASYRIGKAQPPSEATPDDDDPAEFAAAFGVEVGRAVAFGDEFLVGVRHDTEGGASAAVARVSADAATGTLLDLGRSRGDFDAPLVATSASGWLAALLEPNASGATLRLGVSGSGSAPSLDVELEQGRDESLAFDVAPGSSAMVVTWDDVTKDGKLARVLAATLDAAGKKRVGGPVVVSRKEVDAETPRVVPRAGGFWLAYIARKSLALPKKDDDRVLDRNEKGDRYAAEKIDPSWLEVLPLDERGAPTGAPRAITPESGHVLSFDLATRPDGGALLTFRDDDTPSGSHGGRVSLMAVTASGGTEAQVVAEHDVGAGVPTLLPGFLAVPNAAGKTMLAPLDERGAVVGELRLEPAFGTGEPLVAHGDRVLVATSAGTAIDLSVVLCKRTP